MKNGTPRQVTPKGEEIPIPKKGEFLRNLKRVSKVKKSTTSRPKK